MNNYFDIASYLKFQKLSGKLYSECIENVGKTLGLTKSEADVIIFFFNNPEHNSSTDAVYYRGFSKSYVSKAIDLLLKKELISFITDKKDRRIQHIMLSEAAKKKCEIIKTAQIQFINRLTKSISDEEKQLLSKTLQSLIDSLENFKY